MPPHPVSGVTSGPDLDHALLPLESCRPASQMVLQWLREQRQVIIDDWVEQISALSSFYRQRFRGELVGTITEAFEANYEVLSSCRFTRIENFINYITILRLSAGFPLSDVQRAFELFRFIVIRRLTVSGLHDILAQSLEPINVCLAYTIHRFSDYFQRMHERSLREHAENLERKINLRTAELAAGERRYKALVEEINDGYFVLQDQMILFANQAFCRMHGTTLEEALGRPFLSFASPECREPLLDSYLRVLEGRSGGKQIQYIRLGVPQENAATEVKASVVDLGEGPVLIGICRDISERVAMESKVREHERLAYVGHLSASLSHEIRNPLSSIKMNLQILARKLYLGGYDRRRLEIIVHEVSRLEVILHQLLDTARPMTISLAPVNLSVLAEGCVDLLEVKAQEKKITIIERYSKVIPLIQLDAGKLEQAVINLLLNAIEATPEGGRITIWTKAGRKENRHLELGVRDTGPGIDQDQVANLFTPFYTNKSQGHGLGLSNVKRILDAHSGQVDVLSRKGRGAVFVLRLPCHR
ncbi:MAG: PAS domain S-box protein [Deltaproteobacteria bacterium]|nr:PAS domain S-box protein [Deltaproteobacteria bacterium]